MPDYQNSKIYQIICSETGDTYIGSTTQSLAQRKSQHVSNFNQWKKGKGDRLTSFQIIERGNYRIELIELFPCDSKESLYAREGHLIREMKCVNKNIAGRTVSEYYRENREKVNERGRVHYDQNCEKIRERRAQYREQNKNKINERERARYQENREEINEQKARYREQNRDKINERERLRRAKKRAEQQAK
jgi:hypothetical protein